MSLTTQGVDKNNTKVSTVPRRYMLFLLLTLFVVSILTIINHYDILSIGKTVLMVIRWIAIAVIVGFAVYKRSLTTWILISMILGAEFGHVVLAEAWNCGNRAAVGLASFSLLSAACSPTYSPRP